MNGFSLQIASPYVSVEEFARLSGMPAGTVQTMIKDGRLPTRQKIKKQHKPLINMVALMSEAYEQQYTLKAV